MDLVRIVISLICMIFALIIAFISSISEKYNDKKYKKYEDLKYIKQKNKERYRDIYGRHESEYTSLDDAQYHYILDRMKKEIIGGYERKFGIIKNKGNIKKKNTHSWYNFNSWDELMNNPIETNVYLNDRKNNRDNFLFNWDKVFEKVLPYVINEKYESIGVIRLEQDGKTLYVYDMQKSSTMESSNTYAAGISYKLVKKYANIPGYFLFHTHPMGINADPLPSDADLYSCLLDCYSNRFLGHVVIGEYGAVVYFLNFERMNQLESGGALKYFTYCYDLLSAWNALTHSSGLINQKERISFLEKWGFEMIIIPSSNYISDSYNKLFLPSVTIDRFIHTKYELLDKIKDFIKKIETDAEKDKEKNKHIKK